MNIKIFVIAIAALLLSACRLEIYGVGGEVSVDESQQGADCLHGTTSAELCYDYSAFKGTPPAGVTVYAHPKEGQAVTGWSLASCGTSNSCTVPSALISGDYVLKAFFVSQNAFKATWNVELDQYGQYNLAIRATSSIYRSNYSVDWGDGTMSTNRSGMSMKAYDSPGEKKITIYGEINGMSFCMNPENQGVLRSVDHWGDNKWRSMELAFAWCKQLPEFNASDTPNLSQLRSTQGMFSEYDVPNEETLDLSNWNFGSVSNMGGMFFGAKTFPKGIDKMNTSNATTFIRMFKDSSPLSQDISGWNTGNVTDMEDMFSGAAGFNQDISKWATGRVTNMKGMFSLSSTYNSPISIFNQNISGWNTSSVENMALMFYKAESFNQDIGGWDIRKVVNMNNSLTGASAFSGQNYDSLLNGWAAQISGDDVRSDIKLQVEAQHSSAAINSRAMLTTERNWVITDKGCSDC